MRMLLTALALVVAPAMGGIPDDPKSCIAVAGVAVDDEWCRSSCGATTPNCPESVCVCGDQAKAAVLAVPAAVPGAVPAAVPEEASAQAAPAAAVKRTYAPELLGYLENWNDVVWWDNGIPHNCLQGCFEAKKLLNATAPYSAINYGFIFFTNKPSPDQHNCKATKNQTQAQVCPAWDGKALYMSKKSKDGSHAIDADTTLENMTAGLVAIAEAVRLGRMHPDGPKRVKIAVGGWSDYSRFGSAKGAKAAAALAAKAVQYTFADGIDIDLEHLTDLATIPVQGQPEGGEGNEYGFLAAFITALRAELDDVATHWRGTAKARKASLQRQFAEMDDWSKEAFGAYVNTSLHYIDEVANNPVPHLEISWTTRFNAFVPNHDSFNYVKKWIRGKPKNDSEPYGSDNEGARLWPHVGDYVDTVNIMAYDAANITFDHAKILENFVAHGVPAEKINMGFEPGEQAAGGEWQGKAVDNDAARLVRDGGYGGCMIWGANPSQVTNPIGRKACPEVAKDMAEILKPAYRFGPAPKYTKVDHATGWLKSVAKNVWPPPVPSTGSKNSGNKLNAKVPPRGHLMLLSSDEAAAHGPTRPSLRRPRANALVPSAADQIV